MALVGAGVEHVRIMRIQVHFVRARPLVDLQHLLPGLAAVGGLVDAAIAAAGPQRALRCDPDDVGFVGWTTMRPMCSLCFRPMFVNVRPPSSDL
jgi:hypothetical protein